MNTWRGSEPNLSTKRMSSLYLTYTILKIQTRHQEIRSCQTTARSQEIRKTDSSPKNQTEGDGQEIFPGQGTGCQEEYVYSFSSRLTILIETERSEGAELGDEFDIDIDNSEDKPQRGGASARGARGRGGKTSVSPSTHLLPFPASLHFHRRPLLPLAIHRRFAPPFYITTVIFLESGVSQVESALMTRCQDQHETTSTPSVAPPDVTSKTQRKAQWTFQDGTPKPDPPQEAEVDEVDHQVEGEEVGAGHQVIEEEAVKVDLLNVPVNLGESSLSARDDYEGVMYIVNDLSRYLTLMAISLVL
jgi:hypothetical protein